MTYGKIFKELREEKQLSQKELSKITGISQQAISFWEQGKRTPNMDDCITLANFFNITLDELVGRELKASTHYSQTIYDNHGIINQGDKTK